MNASKIGTIEIDNYKLNYRIEGKGKTALVIGSALFYPRTFSKQLREDLRFIFIDHRGFGHKTGESNAPVSLELLLKDIETMRQKLHLEDIIVIGHSGHGYLALEYAKKYPDHISHVVLIALGPNQSDQSHAAADRYFEEHAVKEQKAYLEQNMQLLPSDIEKEPKCRFIHFCLRNGARSWYDYHFDASHLWKGVETNMEIIDHVWGVIFKGIDITQGLESFDKPIFLALGRYDFLVAPPSSWDPILPMFKNLTQIIFDKSGHTPQFEEAEFFDRKLLHWLKIN